MGGKWLRCKCLALFSRKLIGDRGLRRQMSWRQYYRRQLGLGVNDWRDLSGGKFTGICHRIKKSVQLGRAIFRAKPFRKSVDLYYLLLPHFMKQTLEKGWKLNNVPKWPKPLLSKKKWWWVKSCSLLKPIL